jgi:hypothetical protein
MDTVDLGYQELTIGPLLGCGTTWTPTVEVLVEVAVIALQVIYC